MSIYNYSAKAMNGRDVSLSNYKGKVILIVNTASRCGFTFQYKDLEALYKRYQEKDFVILGFPCNQFAEQEPDSNEDVHTFCTLNYGVTFPMFQKIDVRDETAHPLFNYLISQKSFKGFNPFHPAAKILTSLIQEKYPHFLEDDSIKWNFTKFLIDQDGNVVKRFEPTTDPLDMEEDIEKLLG